MVDVAVDTGVVDDAAGVVFPAGTTVVLGVAVLEVVAVLAGADAHACVSRATSLPSSVTAPVRA